MARRAFGIRVPDEEFEEIERLAAASEHKPAFIGAKLISEALAARRAAATSDRRSVAA